MQTLLIWAQSILSLHPRHPSKQRATCWASAAQHLPPGAPGCAATMHPGALSQLWNPGWGGWEGMKAPRALAQSALTGSFPFALLPAKTDWEPVLAWGQEQRTTRMLLAKPKVTCALLENNVECKPLSHKTGPFCLVRTTFSNTQNTAWMPSMEHPIPVGHTVLQAPELSWPSP